MHWKKDVGHLTPYLPFVSLLVLSVHSFYSGVTAIGDEMERSIRIWKDVLMINAVLEMLGGLIVANQINLLLTGTSLDPISDLFGSDSSEHAIMYNTIFSNFVIVNLLFLFNLLYSFTNVRIFSILISGFIFVWGISTIIYLIASCLRGGQLKSQSRTLGFVNLVIPSVIISMLQIFITQQRCVSFVYQSIYMPSNEWILALVLIITMIYFLAVAFCHFSNIYCFIGVRFIKLDSSIIRGKINDLQALEDQREISLRQMEEDLEKELEHARLLNKITLCIRFFAAHVKIYIQGRFYAVQYLLTILHYKITKHMGSMLNPDRLRINKIRFILITAMFELLTADFLLFIYLESDSPCLKFFELISTVFIIPILLSWLMEIKTDTQSMKRNKTETKS